MSSPSTRISATAPKSKNPVREGAVSKSFTRRSISRRQAEVKSGNRSIGIGVFSRKKRQKHRSDKGGVIKLVEGSFSCLSLVIRVNCWSHGVIRRGKRQHTVKRVPEDQIVQRAAGDTA